jgi:hypothetical protein
MSTSQDWFPGRDYPDREVWLKVRAPRVSTKARLIHDSAKGPLILGINAAKRAARAYDAYLNWICGGSKRQGPRTEPTRHQQIVRARHAYYRKVA